MFIFKHVVCVIKEYVVWIGICPPMECYPYMDDLKGLEQREINPLNQEICSVLSKISSPLQSEEWAKGLCQHPDKEFSGYIVRGIKEGFKIGFLHQECSCRSAKSNMRSAITNPTVVEEYLMLECKLGRVVGPLDPAVYPHIQRNRFGVIPKPHQQGKWRLIVDLSHPEGSSVNDGIPPELCSLRYVSVDDAVKVILALGKGTELAKFDIQSAYRIVPVHPTDRCLLGMIWNGQLYVDTALPFGLRSAPKIFTAVADALQFIMQKHGVHRIMHYLDDFLLFGAPGTEQCCQALQLAMDCCTRLGVPIAESKIEGPTERITFLGIELDTEKGELRLPEEKLLRLQREIRRWTSRRSCTKRDLLSLIGQLQHACCVVQPGRTFLRRMINLSTTVKRLHHNIRLNKNFKSDLSWWSIFLPTWNGVGVMSSVSRSLVRQQLTTDASGKWGCGGYTSTGEWFMLEWPYSWKSIHITVKELLTIVMGAALWGKQWQGGSVVCRCDNAAVVAILKSGWCKDNMAMHLLRSLFFWLAMYQVSILNEHIPGVSNGPADALSRNNVSYFMSQVPIASQQPTEVPQELIELLLTRRPDWTSQSWRVLLESISQKALQTPHTDPTVVPREDI